MTTETKSAPPTERVRVRSAEVAIWKNERDGKVSFSAGEPKFSYKHADGTFKTTKSLNGYNLVDGAEALLTANRVLARLRSEAKKASQPVEDTGPDPDDDIVF